MFDSYRPSPTVLLTEAEDIFRPAVQQYIARRLASAWGDDWYEILVEKEFGQSRNEVPLTKREDYERNRVRVRSGEKTASSRLEYWEIAGATIRYGNVFPGIWAGRRNTKRLKEVRRWMNVKRHEPEELTYEGVLGTAIPTMIETLELLSDPVPARSLEQLRSARGSDGSHVDQDLARLVGKAWSRVTPRRSGETETVWLQRLAAFERDAAVTDDDLADDVGSTNVEQDIRRLLARYEEISPVENQRQQQVRLEYLRQQLLDERREAEELGVSAIQLQEWRHYQISREMYDLDLESLEGCYLELLEVSELGMTDYELEHWRYACLSLERNGFPTMSAEVWVSEGRKARRLGMASDEFGRWWGVQSFREANRQDRERIEDAASQAGIARSLGMNPEDLESWWIVQDYRTSLGKDGERLEEGAVEANAARELGMTEFEIYLLWMLRLNYEDVGKTRVSLERYAAGAKAAHEFGITSEELVDRWRYLADRESHGLKPDDLPTWAAQQSESAD